jgi:hypothetical protein
MDPESESEALSIAPDAEEEPEVDVEEDEEGEGEGDDEDDEGEDGEEGEEGEEVEEEEADDAEEEGEDSEEEAADDGDGDAVQEVRHLSFSELLSPLKGSPTFRDSRTWTSCLHRRRPLRQCRLCLLARRASRSRSSSPLRNHQRVCAAPLTRKKILTAPLSLKTTTISPAGEPNVL